MLAECVYGPHSDAVPFAVSAEHPALSCFVSLTTVGGNAFPYDFRGLCDVDTVINPVEGTQASSSAAEQTQPQVQSAQELIPMHLLANDTGRDLAIPSAGPTTVGAIHVMSDDEWTGRLFSNGTFVYAQAQAKEAARDPYANAFVTLLLEDLVHSRRMLSEWPEDLQLEHVPVPNISSLDIQTWMLKTKAAVVRLRCPDQMDNWVFDQFVEELRNHRGVSRSRRLPTFAVSRLDSTQLRSGRSKARSWIDFSLCQLVQSCTVLYSSTGISRSDRGTKIRDGFAS